MHFDTWLFNPFPSIYCNCHLLSHLLMYFSSLQGRSYIYPKMQIRTHLDQNMEKNLSQFWWILDFMCTKRVHWTNIHLSKSNFDWICDVIVIGTLWGFITNQCKVNEGLVIYDFYNLPLPRDWLSWLTAQILMRCCILHRLISVYAVCICSLFECIQPVPHVHTLNFRLATPLAYNANNMDPAQAPGSGYC